MPRTPDAELEERIVAAAMRLLDRGGESAITLRAVAKEAETTTPTIYQRFKDREVLMQRLVGEATVELADILQPLRSIEAIFRNFIRHACAHPTRMSLLVATFGARYVAGEKMPALELLRAHITEEVGIKGREREDLALAIASLAFGTAQGMIAAGSDSNLAGQFLRSAVQALRLLLAAFSRGTTSRVAASGARASGLSTSKKRSDQ